MATELVSTERHGAVLAVTLNSPDTRNSLTLELREQLGAAIALAERDRSVRSVFLSGAGSSFCSGGDFKMLQQASTPWPVHRRFRQYSRWLTPLTMLEKPVVVGVHGYAVGGGMGLALTGDMLIAGESTQFVAGFFRLGAVPDIGVMYQLPRLIGMARAKNFLFGGDTLNAQEALELGLVRKVVPDGQLRAAGLEEAQRLASGPAEVMGLAKMLMARSFEHSLEQMFTYEGLGQALAMSSAEFGEGFHAALEKRSPDFAAAAARAAEAGQ
ncbi:enoyl-CoA hydratase/isomerase family protein [Acidovorax sp. SDU_ACID1]|uniref:enoyl-CoA hydratase/isomerase family protein n=1 Tax=Acidovorax sp. SDU_ACID1 TaxID=3136632 RepID=UPI0038737E1F